MATQTEREAEDRYEARYDRTGGDVPSGDFTDNSYVSAAEGKPIPVVPDEAPVDDPVQPPQSNSDKELARDEAEVIDGSERNVVEERTRHARPVGTYREPGDEEGLPENDGRSAIHQ